MVELAGYKFEKEIHGNYVCYTYPYTVNSIDEFKYELMLFCARCGISLNNCFKLIEELKEKAMDNYAKIQLNSAYGLFSSFIKPALNENSFAVDIRETIKKVIFNDPATIIIWKDDTKTIVKCGENDKYDPEKGLAMAIAKKCLGDKGNYYETFKKYLPVEDEEDSGDEK